MVRGNTNAAPGCVRHVRILGKPGLRIGSGSMRGAASERASIAGRVLGGVAVAPMTRGLQGVLMCRWGAAFDSREGGGLGRPRWAVRLGELPMVGLLVQRSCNRQDVHSLRLSLA